MKRFAKFVNVILGAAVLVTTFTAAKVNAETYHIPTTVENVFITEKGRTLTKDNLPHYLEKEELVKKTYLGTEVKDYVNKEDIARCIKGSGLDGKEESMVGYDGIIESEVHIKVLGEEDAVLFTGQFTQEENKCVTELLEETNLLQDTRSIKVKVITKVEEDKLLYPNGIENKNKYIMYTGIGIIAFGLAIGLLRVKNKR